jgi:hypothetical protein
MDKDDFRVGAEPPVGTVMHAGEIYGGRDPRTGKPIILAPEEYAELQKKRKDGENRNLGGHDRDDIRVSHVDEGGHAPDARRDVQPQEEARTRTGEPGLGVPLDIVGTVDTRDGRLAFVFDRVTNWGGVPVSYAHFDETQFGHFQPGQRVRGTIAPDPDWQKVIVQRLELA